MCFVVRIVYFAIVSAFQFVICLDVGLVGLCSDSLPRFFYVISGWIHLSVVPKLTRSSERLYATRAG